ncbi:MAG TPA: hypothetical protein VMV69_21475 [Pirellulales bacterium]|nr:hypothetical protein [Pirellulales bacterium]
MADYSETSERSQCGAAPGCRRSLHFVVIQHQPDELLGNTIDIFLVVLLANASRYEEHLQVQELFAVGDNLFINAEYGPISAENDRVIVLE